MANFAKGIAAVKKVTTEIKDKPALTSLIHRLDPDGDISSCALTAGVIGNVISSQAVTPVKGIASKSAAEKVAAIETLLQGPKLVAVSIAPDHHFVVIPIDSDKVCILQGFQGVYNLIQWIKHRGQGVIGKAEFLAAMRDFVTTDKARAQAAAVKLFSYSLSYEGKEAADKAKTVEDEIRKYYSKGNALIQMVASKDL